VQLDPLGTAEHNQWQRDAPPLVQVVHSGHGVATEVDYEVALAQTRVLSWTVGLDWDHQNAGVFDQSISPRDSECTVTF
jgi:hypothetical protein